MDKQNTSYVPLEILKEYKNQFDNQTGQYYPCSNQIVLCGILTQDRNKALEFMRNKNIIGKREQFDRIIWILDNGEKWMWCTWNENDRRGYRFYNLAVDRFIDINLFRSIIPRCGRYCCSLEII